MTSWKCILCAQRMVAPKPPLGQRLCPKCAVEHLQKVVDIYRHGGDTERAAQAEAELSSARRALDSWTKEVIQ